MFFSKKVNCKINLGLQIIRKREDGYHEIHTVFYPTDFFTDTLTIDSSSQEFEFTCQSIEDIGPSENNLCVKAFRLLQADYSIPNVRMILDKHIPTGAGLGGGSADAAFTLKMLAEMFELPLSKEQLKAYAARLGSDVPFFIDNRPVFASGRGEIMSDIELDLSDHEIRIIKPDMSVSTKEAYAGVNPHLPETDLQEAIHRPISDWKNTIHNDFEDSIFKIHPQLACIKQQMYDEGAIYAAMTGSGTAVFGIF